MPHLLGAVGRAQIERFKKNILPSKLKISYTKELEYESYSSESD